MDNLLLKESVTPDLGIKSGMFIDQRFHVIRYLDDSRVFLVSDREVPDKLFALKLSDREEIFSNKFNLRREFIIHSCFDHPNITSVTEAFETKNYFGYLMEYVGGGDLHAHILRKKTDNLFYGFHIIKGILTGLAEIHNRNVIHADIKPENILLTSSFKPKITDFGVAREFSTLPVSELDIKGTLKYLCPEYARSGLLHTSVDVYAAGLLAFQILTNQVPLCFNDPVLMFKTRLSKDMPSLGNFIDPETNYELIKAVDKAIDKDPSKRFQDAGEFLAALPDSYPLDIELPESAPLVVKQSQDTKDDDAKVVRRKPVASPSKSSRNKTRYVIEFA